MEEGAAMSVIDPCHYVNRFKTKGMKALNFRVNKPRISNDDGINALKQSLSQNSIRHKLKQQKKVEKALRELQLEEEDTEPTITPITATPLEPEYKNVTELSMMFERADDARDTPKLPSPHRIKVADETRLQERVAGVQKLLEDQNLLVLSQPSDLPKKSKDICKEFCDEQLMKTKSQRLQEGKEYLANKKKKQAEVKAQQEHEMKLKKIQHKNRMTELYKISNAKLRASLQPQPQTKYGEILSKSSTRIAPTVPSRTKVAAHSSVTPNHTETIRSSPKKADSLEFDDVVIKQQTVGHQLEAASAHESSVADSINIVRRSENLKNIHARIQESMAAMTPPIAQPPKIELPKKITSSPLNDSCRSNNSNLSTRSYNSNTSNKSKTSNNSVMTQQVNADKSAQMRNDKIRLQQNKNKHKINKVLDRCSRVNDMLTRISLDLKENQKTKMELEETLTKSMTGSNIGGESYAANSSNEKEIIVLTSSRLPDSTSFIISPPRKRVTFSARPASNQRTKPKKKTRNHIALTRKQYKASMVKAFLSTLAPQQLRKMKAAKRNK
jgi:hypothetical protein